MPNAAVAGRMIVRLRAEQFMAEFLVFEPLYSYAAYLFQQKLLRTAAGAGRCWGNCCLKALRFGTPDHASRRVSSTGSAALGTPGQPFVEAAR